MQIVNVALDKLIPYVSNSRTHSEDQVAQIAASIQEFGWTNPILIDGDKGIIAGHGRTLAARKLGMTEVPCIELSGMSKAQKRAYIIADNKLALNAGWDETVLTSELQALRDEAFDLDVLGFNDDELNQLLLNHSSQGSAALTDEDAVPDVPETPKSKLGDVWLLGKHRVMCGDSTDIKQVDKLMDGAKADMVFTDPPYNTGMTSKNSTSSARLNHMFDDSYTDTEWHKFMGDFCKAYNHLTKDDSFIYVCLDWRRSYELIPHLKYFWKFSNLIVWDKMVHGLGSDYKYTHEFIHVCKKGKPPLAKNKDGDAEYQDMWHIQRKMGRDDEHATKKPIELCERAIQHASDEGELIVDLFLGSGSTLIAADKHNRTCYGMEMNPAYIDTTIKRWQDYTGKQAIHETTKEPF